MAGKRVECGCERGAGRGMVRVYMLEKPFASAREESCEWFVLSSRLDSRQEAPANLSLKAHDALGMFVQL